MAGFKPVKDQIVNILGNITSLKVVYGKEEKRLDKYPAACVSANSYQGEFQTVGTAGHNLVKYQHFIRIYFPTDDQDDADYEDVLEQTVDDVVSALTQNVTLNGSCDWCIPVNGIWRNGDKEVAVRCFELLLESTMRYQR